MNNQETSDKNTEQSSFTNGQKKRNTILFIIAGTLLNVFISLFLIVVLLLIAYLILKENVAMTIPFVFIGAVILGMIIYQKLANWIIKKWNLEEKLEPLFISKHNRSHKKN
jgi:uncharacterized membrane protein